MIDTIDDAYFAEYIDAFSAPIIVDFWAEWCGPCKMVAPILEELDKDYGETIKIAKLNVDFNPDTTFRYNIKTIPTIIFFKNGEPLGMSVGTVSKQNILDKLDELNLL